MTDRRGMRGFTLIELLVVISIIALLIAILFPSLTAARQEGGRLKCLTSLKTVNGHAQNGAVSENTGILHAQSKSGETGWLGLGGWDFGGNDGACGESRSDWTGGAPLSAETRPFNIASAGADIGPNTRFAEYACPSDQGVAQIAPNYVPAFADQSPCSVNEADEVLGASMYRAMGNSFQGDFLWFEGPVEPGGRTAKRFGSFMLAQSKIKAPSELLLFYESRFAQAFLSTQEVIDAGTLGDSSVAVDVAGWHGRVGEFNASFCDGSARKVKCASRGDMLDVVTEVNPGVHPFRSGMLRGATTHWRYDNFPYADYNEDTLSDWVTEHIVSPCPGCP